MIATIIQGRPQPPKGAMVCGLIAALGIVLAAVFTNAFAGAIAAIFGVVAATLFLSRRQLSFRIEERGIAALHSADFVPYAEIQAIDAGESNSKSNPSQFEINLITPTVVVSIPSSINVPSSELLQFLRARLPPRVVSVPDPDIDDYLNRQIAEFGGHRVLWFSAARNLRRHAGRRSTRRGWIAFLVASVLVLAVGIALVSRAGPRRRAPVSDEAQALIAVGAVFSFIGVIGLLIHVGMKRVNNPRIKNFELSSLVVSPLGVALRQGDLKGELKWEEIQDIKLPRNKPLQMRLSGVTVPIFDIYDRPLSEIYARMNDYLR